MNIDWTELYLGMAGELEKSGGLIPPNASKWVGTAAKGLGALAGTAALGSMAPPVFAAGKAAYNTGKSIYNTGSNVLSAAGGLLPIGIGLATNALMGGGGGGAAAPASVHVHMPGKPSSVLNYNTTGVAGLDDMQAGYKTAFVVDSLVRAVQGRLANSVLDEVAGVPQETKETSPKELEISSHYPEMAKLLENEQNKAYLHKLLKDQA